MIEISRGLKLNAVFSIYTLTLAILVTPACQSGKTGAAPPSPGNSRPPGANNALSSTPYKWIPPSCLPLSSEEPYLKEEAYQFLPGSYKNHALQCHSEKRYSEAIVEWEKAIEAATRARSNESFDTLGPHMWLGVDLDLAGFPARARREWIEAIALRPKSRLSESSIPLEADSLFLAGRYSAAFRAFRSSIYPGAGAAFNIIWFEDQGSIPDLNAGLNAVIAGHYQVAKDSFRRSITLSPHLYPAHFLLGCVDFVTGDRQSAIREWETTLFSQSPDPPGSSGFYPVHWAALEMLIHYR
ncbi:MAG: tetratricopeptide repeat protein [Acidobacteriota bacterium]|nr:tetratricopeptide repeat protein [Acidobacteriota bacterium]